jgi:hypothetical protein
VDLTTQLRKIGAAAHQGRRLSPPAIPLPVLDDGSTGMADGSGADAVIRLRRIRIDRREAWLGCRDGYLVLRLARYFKEEWRVPLTMVGVADITSDLGIADNPEHLAFDSLVNVPYLYTTGERIRPNSLLLFDEPQRLPALRPLARFLDRMFIAELTQDAPVDGVRLRAVDPLHLRADLVAHGAHEVTDAKAWLGTTRPDLAKRLAEDTTRYRRGRPLRQGG